jgi:hypothetical protein
MLYGSLKVLNYLRLNSPSLEGNTVPRMAALELLVCFRSIEGRAYFKVLFNLIEVIFCCRGDE